MPFQKAAAFAFWLSSTTSRTIADTSLPGLRVVRELKTIIARRGRPTMCVSDNGTELTGLALVAGDGSNSTTSRQATSDLANAVTIGSSFNKSIVTIGAGGEVRGNVGIGSESPVNEPVAILHRLHRDQAG